MVYRTPVLESVQCPCCEKKSDSIFKVWKRSARNQQQKVRGVPKRISLDQAIVPSSMPSPPRTFINRRVGAHDTRRGECAPTSSGS